MRTTALATACVIACAAIASCSPAASTSAHPPSGQARSGQGGIEAIVSCYRAHGDPSFPSPVYDPGDGRWHFAVPPATAPESTQRACQGLFPSVAVSPPVPQAQFAELVKLADCIRHHGVITWPDPNPQGEFPLPTALRTKSPAEVNALTACQKYIPSGGINAIAASS